jgi:predicted nucleotidyltransferase
LNEGISKILASPMPPEQSEHWIQWELKRLKSSGDPSQIWLFGSAARNALTTNSDLDFLVLFKTTADLKRGRKIYHSSSQKHLGPVDVIFSTESEFESKSQIGGIPFVCRVEGKLLFEAKNELQTRAKV